ncbi:hypothetical protein [Micromonospora chalcea]|uniref:hypothetical protein n=1 Tax=Micromonospora chalcea TaxID=1874 RepID=UPI00381956DA
MDLLTALLALATLASFAADVFAIIQGKRKQGVILLVVFAALVAVLALEARHTAQVEAENRALTDTQARAQRLLESWSRSSSGFDPDMVSQGEAEGIAVAAADLMEDVRTCRPQAFQAALDRVADARDRAAAVTGTSELDITFKRPDIWQEAAAAAVEQVRGVAQVPPNC